MMTRALKEESYQMSDKKSILFFLAIIASILLFLSFNSGSLGSLDMSESHYILIISFSVIGYKLTEKYKFF